MKLYNKLKRYESKVNGLKVLEEYCNQFEARAEGRKTVFSFYIATESGRHLETNCFSSFGKLLKWIKKIATIYQEYKPAFCIQANFFPTSTSRLGLVVAVIEPETRIIEDPFDTPARAKKEETKKDENSI